MQFLAHNKHRSTETLLSDREVQVRLSISRVGLYRIRKKGLLTARKLGGRNVYLSSEVAAFIASLPVA